MASGESKYPFFQKLRTVAASVNNDVMEIERKMRNSKFEMPENNAMFKLLHLSDDMNTYKNDSHTFLQQLIGENRKYTHYRQDIESLVAEMERNIERVEDFLVGYGYKKWHPECTFLDDSDQFQSATSHATPLKEMLTTVGGAAEELKQLSLQKTPVLADYGLTAKNPKYLPSALKDKQESAVRSTKKQVHFESPERQPEKGKENHVPYSLPKTPLLEDYGLPSRKRNQHFLELNQGKDSLCIKKQLNFRSPLSSISENAAESNVTESLAVAEVDSSENFRELVNSLPSGLKNSPPVGVSEAQTDVKISTPEEPFPLCTKFVGNKKNETVTPEEPEIQAVRTPGILQNKENSKTPEEPVATPLSYPFKEISTTPEEPTATALTYTYKDVNPSTPKTPECRATSSFREWLQLQKK